MNMLLQILEEGKLTDNVGRTVDFRNTVILLTSNVGAQLVSSQANIGFTKPTEEGDYDAMKETIMEEAKRAFKPEFLNRLDDVIVFRSLNRESLITILGLETDKVLTRLKNRKINLILSESAKEFLVEKGYDPDYGARPMRRAVERYLEDPLAEEILKGSLQDNLTITVVVEDDHLAFRQEANIEGEAVSS